MSWPPDLEPLSRWLLSWPDPPWRMAGQTVTAWFQAPRRLHESLLGAAFARQDSLLECRLRFYDVEFVSAAPDAEDCRGRFREAVVALPARAGELDGEVSVFMWTDCDTYMTWGREVFGWPLRRGSISLTGPLWQAGGDTGEAVMKDACGVARMKVAGVDATQPAHASESPVWLTPRRLLYPATTGLRDSLMMTAVRPELVTAGQRLSARVSVDFSFDEEHPLHGVTVTPLRAEVHRGFELLVGTSVEEVQTWAM